jgi:hypothetical protein
MDLGTAPGPKSLDSGRFLARCQAQVVRTCACKPSANYPASTTKSGRGPEHRCSVVFLESGSPRTAAPRRAGPGGCLPEPRNPVGLQPQGFSKRPPTRGEWVPEGSLAGRFVRHHMAQEARATKFIFGPHFFCRRNEPHCLRAKRPRRHPIEVEWGTRRAE